MRPSPNKRNRLLGVCEVLPDADVVLEAGSSVRPEEVPAVDLGFGRIVASEIEAPNMLVDLV